MDELDSRVMAKMSGQSLLIALSSQMVAIQGLVTLQLESKVLSAKQAANFLRKAANIQGDNTDTEISRIISAPIEFYSEQLRNFAAVVEKQA